MKKGLLLAIAALLIGCGSTTQYLPIIDASIDGAKGVTQSGKAIALHKEDVAGCYITCALLTALDTAQGAVDGWLKGEDPPGVIPAVDIDLSECISLIGHPPEPILKGDARVIVTATVGGILPAIDAVIRAILTASEVSCEERAVADAVLRYVQSVAPAVVDELSNPDGVLTVPEVVFNSCD